MWSRGMSKIKIAVEILGLLARDILKMKGIFDEIDIVATVYFNPCYY